MSQEADYPDCLAWFETESFRWEVTKERGYGPGLTTCKSILTFRGPDGVCWVQPFPHDGEYPYMEEGALLNMRYVTGFKVPDGS